MAIGVDSSKWKPRRLRGTPAITLVNYTIAAILGTGVAIGGFLEYSPVFKKVRKNFENVYEDPIEEVERRQMIASSLPVRGGNAVKSTGSLHTPPKGETEK